MESKVVNSCKKTDVGLEYEEEEGGRQTLKMVRIVFGSFRVIEAHSKDRKQYPGESKTVEVSRVRKAMPPPVVFVPVDDFDGRGVLWRWYPEGKQS